MRQQAVCIMVWVLIAASVTRSQVPASWSMGGQNLSNTRNQPAETTINSGNANRLTPKWTLAIAGDVSATPAIVGGAVFVTDWGGNLYRLDAATGATIWSRKVSQYTGVTNAVSRTSPAVGGNVVYIGSQDGAHLIAANALTGDAIWVTPIDSHPDAVITQSPVVYNGVIYVGVASEEETSAANPTYQCCTFRGSVVAVNAATGAILWRTYTIPDNGGRPGGYSGGAVWGSTPVVDVVRKSVYIATGNNYTVPQSHSDCIVANRTDCNPANNHFESIMALDLNTGAVKWATGVKAFDAWTVACAAQGFHPNCPPPFGPDSDFASGPNLFTVQATGELPKQLLGAGQKSGIYWALDPATGQVAWATQVGPGGLTGGIQGGSAVEGKNIYVSVSNSGKQAWTLKGGQPVTGGFWSAIDAATGNIVWQTADPAAASDQGAMAVANGVVYAGSNDPSGTLYALDSSNGRFLWTFPSGSSSIAGAAIVNGVVYWGVGSNRAPLGANKLYAFTLR